eukprot:325508-Chlamydomonas_euryale.AAC.2
MRSRVSCECPAVSRHSGSATSSDSSLRPGSSLRGVGRGVQQDGRVGPDAHHIGHTSTAGNSPPLSHTSSTPWQEDGRVGRVAYQLGHVGNDDSRLALDRRLAVCHAADEQRHHDGQRGRLHALYERRRRQLCDGVADLLRARNAAEHCRHARLDVAISVELERGAHC